MTTRTPAILEECAQLSSRGAIDFPEVVRRLAAVGLERYHADYCRAEITYYFPDGSSHVVHSPHAPQAMGTAFDHDAIEAAIRQSQRGEHSYADFVHKTMAAGCVGYFVHITGRCAIYFGRGGERHIEPFPQGPKD